MHCKKKEDEMHIETLNCVDVQLSDSENDAKKKEKKKLQPDAS